MIEGKKNNSYDKFWLERDMDNMAYIFEFCDKCCREFTGIKINKEKFLEAFMNSECRHEMETGHTQLLSQSGHDTVKDFINVDNNGNIEKFRLKRGEKPKRYCDYQLYWVGYMYAYLHYEEDILSRDLIKLFPISEMLEWYYTGHEVSESNFHDRVKLKFDEWRAKNKEGKR